MVARHAVSTARIRAVAARERYAAAALAGGAASVPWLWSDVPAIPAVPGAASELRVWQSAVQDAAAGLRAFRACCDEREDLDRATAARLVGVDVMTGYAPGTGVDAVVDVPLVRALASAAAGTVTAEQARVMAAWFAETAEHLSRRPADVEQLAGLTGFLDRWGDDSELMAAVYASLGAAGMVRLLSKLGEQAAFSGLDHHAAMGAAGSALRSALASASSTWSRREAEAFAAELVQAAWHRNGGFSAIGYLFGDPHRSPVSEHVTVAMADLLDRWERGSDKTWRESLGDPGHAMDDPAMLSLDGAAHDAPARVFETLGLYPQAARDWLTGVGLDWSLPDAVPEFDRGRIEYWFGRRDWGPTVSDGFAGIGALWAGTQTGPGNLPLNRQVAAINTIVFHQLSLNDSFAVDQVTHPGSVYLAKALVGQLPGLVEIGFESGITGERDGLWLDATVPYIDGTVVTAQLSRDWVSLVLTAAAGDDEGRAVLHAGALDYQKQILPAVVHGPASASEALGALVAVWGGVDGATYSAAEVKQYLHDQHVRNLLTFGKTAVGLVAPGGPVTAAGVEVGLTYVQHVAETALTGRPLLDGATHSTAPSSVGSLGEFIEVSVAEYRRLGLWDKTSGHAGDVTSQSLKSIADDFVSEYDKVVDAMRMNAFDELKGEAR